MKDLTKKIIAIFSVVCIAATCLAGCGSKGKNGSESTSDADAYKQLPLEIGSAQDNNPLAQDPGVDLNAEDPTQSSESSGSTDSTSPTNASGEVVEDVTEVQDVTDAQGQPVTESVTVTDAAGAVVTDAAGTPVTEMVKVTTIIKKPSGNTNTETTSTASTESSYTPKQDGRYAMWLDISKDENFYFEGDFLHIKFRIKDDAPDGDYNFKIVPDLSDVKGTAIYPSKVLDGTIRVNKGSIDPIDVSNETGLIFYGDNVACKQGDTIDYYMNIKNNSGLVAFVIWFYFDSNAMDFISAEACGEYEEIARNTEVGSSKKNN